jgi:hypothetical protein
MQLTIDEAHAVYFLKITAKVKMKKKSDFNESRYIFKKFKKLFSLVSA